MPGTKLVIVGGVAGGATAAARARRLSEEAEIIVLERGPYVSFANCGLPYHIGEEIPDRDSLLLHSPESLRARHRLDVRVRHEVVSIDRDNKEVAVREVETGETYRESYDKLILSTGAAPIRPPLPGIDHEKIFTLRTVPDMDRIKAAVDADAKRAVVIGGGFIGLEVAENLKRRGLAVTLLEKSAHVMPPIDREMASPLHDELTNHGIDLRLEDGVQSFADDGGRVTVTLDSGTTVTGDLAILAIGVKPDAQLADDAGLKLTERGAMIVSDRMITSDEHIFAIGDAVAVNDFVGGGPTAIPLAGPANRQGRIAADNVFGRDSRYRGTQGTSIVRVFDLAIGSTGASEKALRQADTPYRKVYLHPAHHVDYFPGAADMHIKLLYAPADGRILGAQIVGSEGVDRRVDVIAMAIQAGMTVYDLEESELAYAPPFGAAKDPVNMAGFIAANDLRADVDTAYADELDGAFVLDVREPEEHEAGAIPGSTLLPLNELRDRSAELPKGRRIVTYCKVGMRGYLAARTLRQLGYDAANLSGGFTTYRMVHPQPVTQAPAASGGPSTSCGQAPAASASVAPKSDEPAATGKTDATAEPAATSVLDVRGLQCPGPIVRIKQALGSLSPGDAIDVVASDPGFPADIPGWCSSTGNELIRIDPVNGHYRARIRKGPSVQSVQRPQAREEAQRDGQTIVVFSNDLDKVLAAFVIANGAASMGKRVTLFFTFWGLNVLRRPGPQAPGKNILEHMFGWMMPKGPGKLRLSQMSMGGMGTVLMRKIMRDKGVDSLPDLMASAMEQGVKLVACSMSMDVMGIRREELAEGVEIGGVGAYLSETDRASANLFI